VAIARYVKPSFYFLLIWGQNSLGQSPVLVTTLFLFNWRRTFYYVGGCIMHQWCWQDVFSRPRVVWWCWAVLMCRCRRLTPHIYIEGFAFNLHRCLRQFANHSWPYIRCIRSCWLACGKFRVWPLSFNLPSWPHLWVLGTSADFNVSVMFALIFSSFRFRRLAETTGIRDLTFEITQRFRLKKEKYNSAGFCAMP